MSICPTSGFRTLSKCFQFMFNWSINYCLMLPLLVHFVDCKLKRLRPNCPLPYFKLLNDFSFQ